MIQTRPNELRPDDPMAKTPGTEPKDRLSHHADDVRQMAGDARAKAGDAAAQAGEKLKEAGQQAKDQVMATARQTGTQVRERASDMLAERKGRLADEVGVFSQALHRAADTLDENQDQAVGRYVHQAADCVDSCAQYLKDADAGQMVRGAGNFTRRHPEVVLGGLFLAGLAAARFLKASDRRRDEAFEGDLAYGGMQSGRDLEGGHLDYGDGGYGDIGMYAGSDEGLTETDRSPASKFTGGPAGLAPMSGAPRDWFEDTGTVRDLPREEPSLTRNEDIPDVTSPQPGSYPPITPSGTFFESDAGQAGKVNPTALDDDLSTIGRNKPSSTDNPNKPR